MGFETSEAFSLRMRDEGRKLNRVPLITSEPYRNGTLNQARAMARNAGQVREIVDALKREMVASGKIPNAGGKGRPRIRRGDMPLKQVTKAGNLGTPEDDARVFLNRAKDERS